MRCVDISTVFSASLIASVVVVTLILVAVPVVDAVLIIQFIVQF